jgi:MFS family permease
LVSIGSVTIYTPAYLKYTYYTQLLTALHINNEQLGLLMSAYAITATITYIPCGFLADRLRMRTLSTVGFLATAALTFWYATLPSFGWCIFIMIAMGVSTILIWWGVRYKLVRLISLGERDYARSIGISYGFYGAAGLGTGLVILWLLSAFGNNAGVSAGLDLLASLLLVMGVLSWLFIPRFVNETGTSEGAFGFKESLQALRRPAVYITAVCMFFVYFYYTCASYTSPYLTTGFPRLPSAGWRSGGPRRP